jgi:ABC-type phosphate/phosphonate transport system substrate-binding protein
MRDLPLMLGALARDERVFAYWEGMREHLRTGGIALDFALYSTYERLVEALLAGHLQLAFSDPLAHVRIRRRTDGRSTAVAMRDIDREFQTKILVRRDAGIGKLSDLEGKTLALGSRDSAHARILPLYFLKRGGVDLEKVNVHGLESEPGKHGDSPTSELLVLAALHEGKAQAGAVGSGIWKTELAAGRVDPHRVEMLWSTPAFSRHVLDAAPSVPTPSAQTLQRMLFEMRWNNPRHKKLFDLEGYRMWVPPREDGYGALEAALDDQSGWLG